MAYVVDISNLQPTLTPQDCNALKAAGVEKVYVGLQYPIAPRPQGNAHLNIPVLHVGGLRVGCYFESTPPDIAWANVRQFAYGIEDFYLAVEDGSGFTDEASINAALAYADALGKGYCGIYSSAYMWAKYELPTGYSGRRLWDADYNGEQTLALRTLYGGWTVADVAQYSEHGLVPGFNFEVDLDWAGEASVVQSEPQSPEFSEQDAALAYQYVRLKGTAAQPGGVSIEAQPEAGNRRIYIVRLPIV